MKITRLKTVVQVCGLCAGVLAAGSAVAQSVTQNYSVGIGILDNDPSGLAVTENFSGLGITQITDLTVTLNISGGFNGDYYAYLSHGSGFSVLLNRVGKDGSNPVGYGNSGFNISLNDSAVNGDIHTYQLTLNPGANPLTGSWAPDARTDDPGTVLTTSPQNADLSSFNGLDPDGNWTLFIADVNQGGVGTLTSFGLTVTGVPEPSSGLLFSLLGGLGFLGCRRLLPRKNPARVK